MAYLSTDETVEKTIPASPQLPLDCYTIVRPSNYLDRIFYLNYRLGAQSNILVSARYASSSAQLTKEIVYSATQAIVAQYPELSIIGIQKPSDNGKHTLHLASLHEIDLDLCVEFLDDTPYDTKQLIETLHNQWDWTDDKARPRRPWWKVVVLERREVIFVYHHMVSDGRFGAVFHNTFLASLNQGGETVSHILKIDCEQVRLSKQVEAFWLSGARSFSSTLKFLAFLFIRIFFKGRLIFSDLPKPKKYYSASVVAEPGPEYRTKTNLATVRIPATKMHRILAACRSQDSTFTPFLIVMTLCALAVLYPDAKVGISSCGLDMRPYYPHSEKGSGKLIQCGNGTNRFTWLDNYRNIFPNYNPETRALGEADIDAAWRLVRSYRSSINKNLAGTNSLVVRAFRAGNKMSVYLENILKSFFPALGFHQRNALKVSNIGAYTNPSVGGGGWRIDQMQFSAAAVSSDISSSMSINVAGVREGDTIVNASYEDGILKEEVVLKALQGAVERMDVTVR